jgi:hypothetical protein
MFQSSDGEVRRVGKRLVLIAAAAFVAWIGPVSVRAGSSSSAWDKLGTLLTGKHFDDKFKLIHVGDLAGMRADPGSQVAIFDANVQSTREKYGVIPGARLLSSYDDYDVAKELPSAKNARLVFYCANTH